MSFQPSPSISCLGGIFRSVFQTSFTFSLLWLATYFIAFSCHPLKNTTLSAGLFSLSSCLISLQHLPFSISFSHFLKISPFLFLFTVTLLVLFLSRLFLFSVPSLFLQSLEFVLSPRTQKQDHFFSFCAVSALKGSLPYLLQTGLGGNLMKLKALIFLNGEFTPII